MKKILMFAVILLNLTVALYAINNFRNRPNIALSNEPSSPSIESCDSDGNTVNNFNQGDPVYVKGSGLEPGGLYYIYIVKDYSSWINSETCISDLDIVEEPIMVDVDAYGNIENQPVLIWASASQGYYDIWADSQVDGEIDFYDECDVIDNLDVNGAGFFVISEILLITTPILFAYLATLVYLKRRNITR
jgi:hypothetical protein